jgi:hypothetical protein
MRILTTLLLLLASLPAFPDVIVLPGGTPQSATAGRDFPNAVQVRVTNAQGNPVAGARVTFGLPGIQDLLAVPNDCQFELAYFCERITNANGIADLGRFRAEMSGRYEIPVDAYSGNVHHGTATLVFDVAPLGPPAQIQLVSGHAQTAVLGNYFQQAIRLRLVSPSGVPLAGQRLNLVIQRGPIAHFRNPDPARPDFASASIVTDADGYAETTRFYAELGVGAGTVTVFYADPVSRAYVYASVPFTTTYPDGSTFVTLQDIWWAPGENGWGTVVAQHGERLFNVLYDYDTQGNPTWHVMSSGNWIAGFGSHYMGPLYKTTGSPFYAYDASKFSAAAEIANWAVRVTSRDKLTLAGDGSFGSFTRPIERFDFSKAGQASPIQGVGDIWWGGAAQDGWGMSIIEQAGGLFVVWFTYGAEGRPTWFLMSEGRWSDTKTWTGPVYATRGSQALGAAYDASRLIVRQAGQFSLRFENTQRAAFTYDIDGRKGTLELERFAF